MNKIEKLIKLFKSCDTVTFTVTGCGEESYKTIEFKNIIEELEKQIPKKPYYLNYGGYNVGNWNHGIACICDYKASYCRHCGQKLDWEVENE